jgi:6-phosphogluconolactonase
METFVKHRSIKVYNLKKDLFLDAAELFFSEAKKAIKAHGKFSVAISGGSTPIPLYELLSSAGYHSRIDWKLIHFFWADERCVPKDHPDSNFKTAYELFLSKLPIPETNLHRIHGELDATTAASAYEIELKTFFGESALPAFDLILLGVGADGHTASIFPEIISSDIISRTVIDVYIKKLDSYRVSLNIQVLDNSGTVAFIVTGKSKANVLREILEDGKSDFPAARVNPRTGRSIWFVDREAASLLSHQPCNE